MFYIYVKGSHSEDSLTLWLTPHMSTTLGWDGAQNSLLVSQVNVRDAAPEP